MMNRSIRLYLFGFISGFVVFIILHFTFPRFVHAALAILIKKTEVQADLLGGSLVLAIFANNLTASLIAAFGGYTMSKAFFSLKNSSQGSMPRFLGILNVKSRMVPKENLRYFLALYVFPTFVLFINGFVLGGFATVYLENFGEYLGNLLPHGIFEIPGILISGNIGLTIADESIFEDGDIKENLNRIAKRQIPSYLLVLELLIISALLEVVVLT